MKFTLDTEAKTIELLSSVTIKELIELRNTIKDFDLYTVKGKINEVQNQLDKPKGLTPSKRIGDILEEDRYKKIKEDIAKEAKIWNERFKRVNKSSNPFLLDNKNVEIPKWEDVKNFKIVDHVANYNKFYNENLITSHPNQILEWYTTADDYSRYHALNNKTETVDTEM